MRSEVNDDHPRDTDQHRDHDPPDGSERADRRVAKLAELDSRAQLEGAVLGAEVEGRLLAAISLNDGRGRRPVQPHGRAADLLELRAGQLRDAPEAPRWQRRAARDEPRIALGGSPAGQIISLMLAR